MLQRLMVTLIAAACLATVASAAPPVYYSSETGSYYQAFEPEPVRPQWSDASAGANRTYTDPDGNVLQGRLVTINTQAESDFLGSTLLVNGHTYWTDGRQAPGSAEPAGGWGWGSGEPFAFTNWQSGQPDDRWREYGYNENRIILAGPSGRWGDYPASWRCDGYIVEYPSSNRAPTADAGGPYETTTTACSVEIYPDTINLRSNGGNVTAYMMVDSGACGEVTLDGSASSDPDGDPLIFTWNVSDSNGNEVTCVDGATPTVALPVGLYVVTLVVDDGKASSEPATGTIEVLLLDLADVDAASVTACGPAPGTPAQCLGVAVVDVETLLAKFDRLALCETLVIGEDNLVTIEGMITGQDTVRVINPGKKK